MHTMKREEVDYIRILLLILKTLFFARVNIVFLVIEGRGLRDQPLRDNLCTFDLSFSVDMLVLYCLHKGPSVSHDGCFFSRSSLSWVKYSLKLIRRLT